MQIHTNLADEIMKQISARVDIIKRADKQKKLQ